MDNQRNVLKVAKEVLAESDFASYEVIVKDSTIPEARNIYVQNVRGDCLSRFLEEVRSIRFETYFCV